MIVSIHQFELAEGIEPEAFEAAIEEAESRGLFDLQGLENYRFLYGIKGTRRKQYTALWEYESREAWESLWGSVDDPKSKAEYPESWIEWEDDLLAPLLANDPDEIEYTTYRVLSPEDNKNRK